MGIPGYAVVDVETTGLSPTYHHRIVEIAVVQTDEQGRVEREWSTLLNPGRDVGPTHIHGITATDVADAPSFADAAYDIAVLLQGRLLVAHNSSFDTRFLAAEFADAGWNIALDADHCLCTMRLAATWLPTSGRSLAVCCEAAGISNSFAHSALGDARAAAALFAFYLQQERPPRWHDRLQACASAQLLAANSAPTRVLPRGSRRVQAHWMTRLADRLPRAVDPTHDSYLALLDTALLDKHLSISEQDALIETAAHLGIDRIDILDLHRRYLDDVAAAAWADGVITDTERTDLGTISTLLGLTSIDVESSLRRTRTAKAKTPRTDRFQLHIGDQVVLTGDMRRERTTWEAELHRHGLQPHSSVTKKTRLLAAADPNSQSGKARLARRYGIPIITEQALGDLLAHIPTP